MPCVVLARLTGHDQALAADARKGVRPRRSIPRRRANRSMENWWRRSGRSLGNGGGGDRDDRTGLPAWCRGLVDVRRPRCPAGLGVRRTAGIVRSRGFFPGRGAGAAGWARARAPRLCPGAGRPGPRPPRPPLRRGRTCPAPGRGVATHAGTPQRLGQCCAWRRRPGRATLAYRRALVLHPGHERAARNLAWLRDRAPPWLPRPVAGGALDSLLFWRDCSPSRNVTGLPVARLRSPC